MAIKGPRVGLPGEHYNMLTITERRGVWALCLCDCGQTVERVATAVVHGTARSCGCANIYHLKTHGRTGTPAYGSWSAMRRRCRGRVPNTRHLYEGLEVQEEWLNSFEAFLADMGERPPGMSIDRIDGTKGYIRGNCRWADAKTQANNRRGVHWVQFHGATMTLTEAAEAAGIARGCVHGRYRKGVRGDALFIPPRSSGKRRLTAGDAVAMRAMRSSGVVLREIAERFGVSLSHTCSVIKGRHFHEEKSNV